MTTATTSPALDPAWDAALCELEESVRAAEAVLSSATPGSGYAEGADLADLDVPAWTPPTGLGPLPADLRPRAERLLTRQQYVSARLADAADRTRRELAAVARLEATADRSAAPAFLDSSA